MRRNKKINFIKVNKDWIGTKGRDSTVLVCDSGCDIKHYKIREKILDHKSFCGDFLFSSRHGTHVSGIINSIAPECNIVVAQVTRGSGGRVKDLCNGILWGMQYNPDVINMSLSFVNISKELDKIITECISRNIILVAPSIKREPFPASYEGVVSVGSFKRENFSDVYCPESINSLAPNNGSCKMRGVSMSCAFFSGVATLAKSYNKFISGKELVKTLV